MNPVEGPHQWAARKRKYNRKQDVNNNIAEIPTQEQKYQSAGYQEDGSRSVFYAEHFCRFEANIRF
jgi:hypothetical protein